MSSVWKTNFKNFEIKVKNTWFNGERLFINDELKDEKFALIAAVLKCEITDKDDTVHRVKVHLGGFFSVKCRLFIDDKEVEITQIQ